MSRKRFIRTFFLSFSICFVVACSDDTAVPPADASRSDSQYTKDAEQPDTTHVQDTATISEGSSGNDTGLTCESLVTEYQKTLAEAKICWLQMSKLQCTEKVADALYCSCPTYVNPDNTEAVAMLSSYQQAWTAMSCTSPPCSTEPCPEYLNGACDGPGTGGSNEGKCINVGGK